MDYINKLYNLYQQHQYDSILSQSGGLACSKLKKKECSSHKECDWVAKKGCKKKTASKKKSVALKKKTATKKKPIAPKKKTVTKKQVPKNKPVAPKKKTTPPKKKPVVSKKKSAPKKTTDNRISASEYYKKFGEEAIGDIVDIRNNGELKCLLKRSNGTVYWASKSKSGKGQEQCGHGLPGKWRPNTRIDKDERQKDFLAAGYKYNEDGDLYDPTMGMDDDEREEYEARHPPPIWVSQY